MKNLDLNTLAGHISLIFGIVMLTLMIVIIILVVYNDFFHRRITKKLFSDIAVLNAEMSVCYKVGKIIDGKTPITDTSSIKDDTMRFLVETMTKASTVISNAALEDIFGLSCITDDQYESLLRSNGLNLYVERIAKGDTENAMKRMYDRVKGNYEYTTVVNPSTFTEFAIARISIGERS
jgi:hypothetical protein